MAGTRFDHIAIGMPRIADALPFLVGELGGRPAGGRPSGEFTWAAWRYAGGGAIEVIEPRGHAGFLHRFLAQGGPRVHHVTFKVSSLEEACARAEAHGYAIVGRDESNPAWMEAFLHPKRALGIVVQLAEAREPSPPGAPRGPREPAGPAPARIVGLGMRACSAERARAQWSSVLGGTCHQLAPDRLVFAWPGSPMRIVVDLDPVAEEGPAGILVDADRPLALPAGPHPVLGTVFRRPDAALP